MKTPIDKERLRKLNELFDAFEIVADGAYVYLCDMAYDYSRWSRAAVDYFKLPSEYLNGAGQIWEEHIHPEDRATYRQSIEDVFSGSSSHHDMQYRAMDRQGRYVTCTCRGIVLYDIGGNPEYFCGIIRNQGIVGNLDALTGLRNLYGFFEDLRIILDKRQKANVMIFGPGRFSEVNAMFGYDFGNLVLQKGARHLLMDMNLMGSVYRLDGTRFAIITEKASVDELRRKYDEITHWAREAFEVEGHRMNLRTNGGILTIDTFDVDHHTVFSCLNHAYDVSKNDRQGQVYVFENGLSSGDNKRLEMLNAVRQSVLDDCENFRLYYQAIVDADTERIVGAEALIRWQNDEYGIVPPNSFIPVLENDALFPRLGQWIMRRGMSDFKTILEKHPDFMLNINLSYSQLERIDFTESVENILKEMDYPGKNLCLEITERCRLLDVNRLKNVNAELESLDVCFALDDFGTGFASVGVLKDLKISTIKVDRMFVTRIEENPKDRQLIGSITDLASIYGARICVEGVETPAQKAILRNIRVDMLQGYLYSKPVPFDEFVALVEHK